MSLCGIPYFYSDEFEEIYYSMIDFLCFDKEFNPDYVMFQDNKIYIKSDYTNWIEEEGLVNSSLIIILDYCNNKDERDILGYEVKIDFLFQINGEVIKDEVYKRRFKNLEDVEDYNNWVDLKYHITPWIAMFKKYEEREEDYK